MYQATSRYQEVGNRKYSVIAYTFDRGFISFDFKRIQMSGRKICN